MVLSGAVEVIRGEKDFGYVSRIHEKTEKI